MDFEFISKSADETSELGKKLGSNLRGGEIIGLIGELGSGKTHLIKGIAAGVGDENQTSVSSPTFVIVNEYLGRLSIYHIDAYRLESAIEFEQIGFDDYCRPDSVVLLEWADKVLPALAGTDLITIELSHLAQNSRAIKIINAPQYLLKGV